jgi:HSP20 family protein
MRALDPQIDDGEEVAMLMRTDPFREVDRLAQQVFGTTLRPVAMPMNAYRKGDSFLVQLDLPGVEQDSIDLTVEQNVLTVRATRAGLEAADDVEVLVSECPAGTFTRQVFLGETLDPDHIEADYNAGVLTLSIPVREAAKPRKVEITTGEKRESIGS